MYKLNAKERLAEMAEFDESLTLVIKVVTLFTIF